MSARGKATLTPAAARAVEALRRCDAEAVRSLAAYLREDAAALDDETAHWAKLGCPLTAKDCRKHARAYRAAARVVRALLVTALALACAGCEGPCVEKPAHWTHVCDERARIVPTPSGLACACPGSPLLDGGR